MDRDAPRPGRNQLRDSMPVFYKHRPTGLLARHIESFWYRPALPGAATTGMLVLPAGRAEFVISLGGERQTSWTELDRGGQRHELHHATVRLPGCAAVATSLSGRGAAFGVSFKPHGLRHFSRVPLADVAPGIAALEAVWGPRADELVERLAAAPTPAAKFVLMETLFWNQLREPHGAYRQVEHAVGLLADPFSVRSIDSVAGEVGLSSRRLLDLFRQDVGLSPKSFARVMRFGAALRLVREKGPTRWTDVAAMCNYFDQAHFVREFRSLAGMAPTAYLERRAIGHANCLPWDPATIAEPERPGRRESRQAAFTASALI